MLLAYSHCSFYGILLCQGRWYFKTYQEDPVDLKVTVGSTSYAPDGMGSSRKWHPQVAGILYEDFLS